MTNQHDQNDIVKEEAVNWILRIQNHDLTEEEQTELNHWIEQSALHKDIYASLNETWDMMTLVEMGQENITHSQTSTASDGRFLRFFKSFFGNPAKPIATAFSALMIIGLWNYSETPQPLEKVSENTLIVHHETTKGEQDTATLNDGSSIVLNTDTEIATKYSANTREADLIKGEAYFKISKNPDRPFIITSGKHRVTVLGTEFSVQKTRNGIDVNVFSGRVAVQNNFERSDEIILNGGDKIKTLQNGAYSQPERTDIDTAFAWKNGLIIFENTPLQKAITEINRYQERQIFLRCNAPKQTSISGVFRIDSLDETIDAVKNNAALVTDFSDEKSLILKCAQ
jgi:transmembrane sensor